MYIQIKTDTIVNLLSTKTGKLEHNKDYDWNEHPDSAICDINSMCSTITGYSPYYLIHGHHQRLCFEAEAEQNYNLAEVIESLSSETELAKEN